MWWMDLLIIRKLYWLDKMTSSCVCLFTEALASAKEENKKIHATLDQTLQDLNSFWTSSVTAAWQMDIMTSVAPPFSPPSSPSVTFLLLSFKSHSEFCFNLLLSSGRPTHPRPPDCANPPPHRTHPPPPQRPQPPPPPPPPTTPPTRAKRSRHVKGTFPSLN